MIECGRCQKRLHREDAVCPVCGSMDRNVSVGENGFADDSVWLIREKHPKTRSPRSAKLRHSKEIVRGWERNEHGTHTWLQERLIDRDRNVYHESGTLPDGTRFETGPGPLDGHIGHGSAKCKRGEG